MSTIDWFWTGRNNAKDGKYLPPQGIGYFRVRAYELGWLVGACT